ncbi:MAG TPA: cytochrome c oxidase subunit II [Candidatus Saccharimonadales bacterium]|nr:cytochrome c oxidase subunit II [Candidatus Saccharimonadales bacterium]
MGALRAAALAAVAALAGLPGAARAAATYPQSTFYPHSEVGGLIQSLLNNLLFWVFLIFVVVETLLVVAMVRFRRRRESTGPPEGAHGHTGLEVAWSLAPVAILACIAVPTVGTIFRIGGPAPPGALQVNVVGHQWWWEFQYPQLGVVTANELHLPVGRAASFRLQTADVIHSFWLPGLSGKRDVVPARTNQLWFTPDRAGTYRGQCAEFCGESHANMRMLAVVETPQEFDAWVRDQRQPGPPPAALAARGAQVFSQSACIGCHTIQGVSAGVLGPNLTHVGSRSTLAAGVLPNTPESLGRWLQDPPATKPGTLMPNLNLGRDQIQALVAYLESRK